MCGVDQLGTAAIRELAFRLLFAAAGTAARLARSYPLPTIVVVAAAGFTARRTGWMTRERLSTVGRELANAARPWMARAEAAFGCYQQARAALKVVEPYGLPNR